MNAIASVIEERLKWGLSLELLVVHRTPSKKVQLLQMSLADLELRLQRYYFRDPGLTCDIYDVYLYTSLSSYPLQRISYYY